DHLSILEADRDLLSLRGLCRSRDEPANVLAVTVPFEGLHEEESFELLAPDLDARATLGRQEMEARPIGEEILGGAFHDLAVAESCDDPRGFAHALPLHGW